MLGTRGYWVGLAVVLCLGSAAGRAEVYRWVDEQGRVHFGDQPQVMGQEPIEVNSLPASPGPDDAERRQRRDRLLGVFAEERRRERARSEEARARRQARARECSQAQGELADLQRGGAFFELDDRGERVYLDEQQIGSRVQHWRGRVKEFCEPA